MATTYFRNKEWQKSIAVQRDIMKLCHKIGRFDLESFALTEMGNCFWCISKFYLISNLYIGTILTNCGNREDGRKFLSIAETVASHPPTKYLNDLFFFLSLFVSPPFSSSSVFRSFCTRGFRQWTSIVDTLAIPTL